jgi:hypothetical protein
MLNVSIQILDKPAEKTSLMVPLKFKDMMLRVLKEVCDLELELLRGETTEKDGHIRWTFDCNDEKAGRLREIMTEAFNVMINAQPGRLN